MSHSEKYDRWKRLGEWKVTVTVTTNDRIAALMEERQELMRMED